MSKYFRFVCVCAVVVMMCWANAASAEEQPESADVAQAAEIRDKFKTDVDEFSGLITFFPSHYENYDEFVSSGIPLPSACSLCTDVELKDDKTSSFNYLITFVHDHNDSWIFADTIYIIAGVTRYTISYPRDDIATHITTGGIGVEMYFLNQNNMPVAIQESIHGTESIKIRVGSSEVVKIEDWQLQDMKDAIELYWSLEKK